MTLDSKNDMDKKQDNDDKPQNSDPQIEETVSKEEFDRVQTDLSNLQGQFDDLGNQLKRAVADYQNLEKRINEGKAELSAWATAELVKRLLPVLDNLDQVDKGASEDDKKSGWFKGMQMSVKSLRQILESEGLEQIESDGQFDPTLHEAVDTRDGDDNIVLEVVRAGYRLNGKILRPAQVVVGKKS